MKTKFCQMANRVMRSSIYVLLAFLLAVPQLLIAQNQVTVKGTILESRTETPLPGVSVVVKGSNVGTKTDANGQYTITTKKGDILVFSFTGYQPFEISVADQSIINHTLVEGAASNLDEVVVIGYGTTKRKDLTGAVASVSGEQLAATPVANAAQALQGKLPGVNVTTQDGRPDAAVSIRVRGSGSISQSNEPLYIVDGFPVGNINDIPASQIESIDVLKDASSTAIYGARGANGVIIITTKSGHAGKLKINYDGWVQWNKPVKYMETMNAYDYIAYNWAYAKAISNGYAKAWEELWAIGASAATYNNPEGIDHYKNVKAENYAKQIVTSSFSHNHSLTMSGGTTKTKYLVSGSYTDNDGMKINSFFKRANALLKLDQKIGEKFRVGIDARITSIERMGNEGTTNGRGSILSTAYQFRPIATSDVLGELDDTKNTQLGLYDIVLQDQFNPVARTADYEPLSKERSLRTNGFLSWEIIKNLVARTEFGYSFYTNRGKTWAGAVYNNYIDPNTGLATYSGNASLSSSEGWAYRWVNTLNYIVPGLGHNHNLNFTLGQEANNSYSESFSIYGNRFPKTFTKEKAFANMQEYTFISGQSDPSLHGFSSNQGIPNRITSYFGRLNYALMDRYLFTVTFRADGSSRFAPNNRWGYFPAAAVAWRASDEPFLKNVGWLDNLKFRASYGEVGNDNIGGRLWLTNWGSDGFVRYSVNEEQLTAYSPGSIIGNPDIKWETTITQDVGVDFTVFNKRLNGTVDLYWNKTKDLLWQVPINRISGFDATYDNVGSTSRRGVEVSLNGDIVRTKNLLISAGFNINFNKSQVDELAPGINGLYKTNWGSSMTQPNTGDYILMQGQPVGLVRGYTYDGWYTTADFDYNNGMYTLKKGVPDIASGIAGTVYGTNANKPGGQSAYPGVIKFKDISGPNGVPDGKVDENDVSVIGDMNPKHTGGFNLTASFMGIDFGMYWNWSYGNMVYNADYLAAFYGSKEDGLYRNRLNYLSTAYKIYDIQGGQLVSVTEPAKLDALNANATVFLPYHENPIASTLGIQDGSFLRLNTLTLGYSLPASLTDRVKITRLRVYGSIYNALLITSYDGIDPEVNTNISQGGAAFPTIGLDWGSYPRPRSFTIGLNLEF